MAEREPDNNGNNRDGQKKKAVVWELRDNLLYPHLVTKGESNGMLTAIAGETLREGMEIVSTAQILTVRGTVLPPPPAGKTRSRPKCPRAASLAQAIQKRQPRPETTALPRLPDPGNRHHSTS